MASTINVYAYDLGRPAREDDATTTETAYAASKLAAESELRDAYVIEPGHDAWVVGSEPFVAYEFDSSAAETYARG